MPAEELDHFEMMVPPAWLQAVDDWRAKQGTIPSRSDAIRHLVEQSLLRASASLRQREQLDVWDADVARLHQPDDVVINSGAV